MDVHGIAEPKKQRIRLPSAERHPYRTLSGRQGTNDGLPIDYEHTTTELELYDLKSDREERQNVADQPPELVARLQEAAETARRELGDRLTDRRGNAVRPADRLGETDERFGS